MAGVFGRLTPRIGAQASVTGEGWTPYKVPDILVPARDFAAMGREELELAVDELAMKGEFRPPAGFDQADVMGMDDRELRDLLRQAEDEINIAPLDQETSSRNWFMGTLATIGGAIAGPAMKVLDPIAAFGEMGASAVMGGVQGFIPGEQEYERLLREKKEARGLSGSLLDWITDPGDSIAAQREAWHEMEAPWGTKFAMEIIFDPLNLIPFKWITVPIKGAARGAKYMARGMKPLERSIARQQGMKYATKIANKDFKRTRSLDDLDGEVSRLRNEAASRPKFIDPRLLIGDRTKRGSLLEQAKRLELSVKEIREEIAEFPLGEVSFRYSMNEIRAGRMPHPQKKWTPGFFKEPARAPRTAADIQAGARPVFGPPGGPFRTWKTRPTGIEAVRRGTVLLGPQQLGDYPLATIAGAMEGGKEGARRLRYPSPEEVQVWDAEWNFAKDQGAPPEGMIVEDRVTGESHRIAEGESVNDLSEQLTREGGKKRDPAQFELASWQPAAADNPAISKAYEDMIATRSTEMEKVFKGSENRQLDTLSSDVNLEADMSKYLPVGDPDGKTIKKRGRVQFEPDPNRPGQTRMQKEWAPWQLERIRTDAATEFQFAQSWDPGDVHGTWSRIKDPADKVAFMWYLLTGMRRIEISRIKMNSLNRLSDSEIELIETLALRDPETVGHRELLEARGEVVPDKPAFYHPPKDNPLGLGNDWDPSEYHSRRITHEARAFLRAYMDGTPWSLNIGDDANQLVLGLDETMYRDTLLRAGQDLDTFDPTLATDVFLGRRAGKHTIAKYVNISDGARLDPNRNVRIHPLLNRLGEDIGVAAPEGIKFTALSLRHHFVTQMYVGDFGGFGPEGITGEWIANYVGHVGVNNLVEYLNLGEVIKRKKLVVKSADGTVSADPRSNLQINNKFIDDVAEFVDNMPVETTGQRESKEAALNAIKEWHETRVKMLASDMSQFVSNPEKVEPGTPRRRTIPANTKKKVFERDNFTCRYCDRPTLDMTVDHIVPVSQEGGNNLDNLVAACSRCNMIKAGRTPDQARMLLIEAGSRQAEQWPTDPNSGKPGKPPVDEGLPYDNPYTERDMPGLQRQADEMYPDSNRAKWLTETAVGRAWAKKNPGMQNPHMLRAIADHVVTRLAYVDVNTKDYISGGHIFYDVINYSEGTMLRALHSQMTEAHTAILASDKAKDWAPEARELYSDYASALEGFSAVRAFLATANVLELEAQAGQKMYGKWAKGLWRDIQSADPNTSKRALLNAKNLGISLRHRIQDLEQNYYHLTRNAERTGADAGFLELPPEVHVLKDQVKGESLSIDAIFKQGTDSATARGQSETFGQVAASYFREAEYAPLKDATFRRVSQAAFDEQPMVSYEGRGWEVRGDKEAHMEPHLVYEAGSGDVEWIVTNRYWSAEVGEWMYEFRRINMEVRKQTEPYMGKAPVINVERIEGFMADGTAFRDVNLMTKAESELEAWKTLLPLPDYRVIYPRPKGVQPWDISKVAKHLMTSPDKVGNDRSWIDMKFKKPTGDTPQKLAAGQAAITTRLRALLGTTGRPLGQRGLYKIFTGTQYGSRGAALKKTLLVTDPDNSDMLVFNMDIKEAVGRLRDARGQQIRKRQAGGAGRGGGRDGGGGIDAGDLEPMGMDEWDKLYGAGSRDNDLVDYANKPRDVKDHSTDMQDSTYRKYMQGWQKKRLGARVGRASQMPIDWVFGENMGRSWIKKLIGGHASARDAGRFRGAQVLGRMQHGGDLLGYSSKYGRMMNVKLTGEIPPHVKALFKEEGIGEYGAGITTGRPGWFGRQFKKMPDWEWETRRVTTMLEMPRNMLKEIYELTPEQLRFYDSYHLLILNLQHMAKTEGYDISKWLARDAKDLAKFGPDDPRYVPHLQDLTSEINRDTGLPTVPILGSKPKFFESREFKTMLHGELLGQLEYTQDPVEALKQLFEGVYGFVADQQLFREMELHGLDTRQMSQKVKLGEGLLDALRLGLSVDETLAKLYPVEYTEGEARITALESFFGGYRTAVDKASEGKLTDEAKNQLRLDIEDQTSRYFKETQSGEEVKLWRAFRNLIPDNETVAKMSYTQDAAKELKDYVSNMSEAAALKGIGRFPSIWSSYVRTLSTTFDLGSPLIHGFPLLTMMPLHAIQKAFRTGDPFAAIKWHETPWGEGVRHMFGALRDPAVRDKYRSANNNIMLEMKEHGVAFFGSELRELTGSAIRQLGDVPGPIGKVTKRFEVTFNTFLDVARVEYYKSMRQLVRKGEDGLPLASDLGELAAAVNKVTGGLDPVRAGISNHQRAVESTFVMFAPMLRRATAALIFKAGEGIALAPLAIAGKAELGLERRQALSAIGSIMTAMTAMGYMIYASGNNKKVFDTDSADFMSMKFGDSRMGIGTPFYALSRMGSGILNQMKTDPGGLLKFDIEDHAVLKMARSMTSPSTGSVIDLIMGRNFIGDPLRDVDGSWEKMKITRFLARQGMPFWAESFTYDFTGFNRLSAVGEFAGLRASPLPKSRQLKQLQEIYLMGDSGDEELTLWRSEQLSKGEPVTVNEAPALVMDRLNARHEDLQALQEDMQTSRLARGDAKVQRMNDYMEAIDRNRTAADVSMNGFSAAFERGEIDGKTFRTKITEASAELRGAQESLEGVFKDVIEQLDEGRVGRLEVTDGYLGDLFYDQYRARVTDHPTLEDEYGNFRPEIFRQLEASFRVWVGDSDTWDYIQRRKKRNRDFSPTVRDLYSARETLKPYWTLYESVWKRGSWQAELVASYMGLPTHAAKRRFKENYPKIGPLLRKYERARVRYREENPDADAALVRFYDYNPVDMRVKPRRRGV